MFDATKCRRITQPAFIWLFGIKGWQLCLRNQEPGWPTFTKKNNDLYVAAEGIDGIIRNICVDLQGKIVTPTNWFAGSLMRMYGASGDYLFDNCGFINVGRDGPGQHTEGGYYSGDDSNPSDVTLTFNNCDFISGTYPNADKTKPIIPDGYGFHWETGSLKLFRFVNTRVSWHLDIGLASGCSIGKIEHFGCQAVGPLAPPNGAFSAAFTKKTGYSGDNPPMIALPANPLIQPTQITACKILLTETQIPMNLNPDGDTKLTIDGLDYKFTLPSGRGNIAGIEVTYSNSTVTTYKSNPSGSVKLTFGGFTYSFSK